MKKSFGDYYLGLDCGTNSVGWAVTDTNYNILKFNGKSMWGIRLFEDANSAEERRNHRSIRRRYMRKSKRIDLLQELFAEEISKIDPLFFLRLNESRYYLEDKTSNVKFSLFNDSNYTDEDYHREYPTIFHLRYALLTGKRKDESGAEIDVKYNPRLVYLACHHILKNRGHFLFNGEDIIDSPKPLFESLNPPISDLFKCSLTEADFDNIKKALKLKKKSERKDKLFDKLKDKSSDNKYLKILCETISGYKVKISDLFDNEEYKNLETPKISFTDNSFEEDLINLRNIVSPLEYEYIKTLKAIYDWSVYAWIMDGYSYVSEAKIKQYEKNRDDLRILKKLIKDNDNEEKSIFNKIFNNTDGIFSKYIKHIIQKSGDNSFYSEIKKILGKMNDDAKKTEEYKNIMDKIENDDFLTLLRTSNNATLPRQIHEKELKGILEKASEHLDFLNKKDFTKYSVSEKIVKIFEFKIPYYVGPFSSKNVESGDKFSWYTRKEDGEIMPWNFEQKVDVEKSAEDFISLKTNKCTYCREEDVLPKNSLLYSKFSVLNELNMVKINGESLTIEQKQIIFNDLFKIERKITKKKLSDFCYAKGWYSKGTKLDISGIDKEDTTFNNSLGSYIDFKEYLESKKLNEKDVEDIIRWITIFGDDKKFLEKRLKTIKTSCSGLDEEDISDIIKKCHYSGWGRFSKKFLTDIYDTSLDGKERSLIKMLWETNNNLMMLLSNKFNYMNCIKNMNNEKIDILSYNVVEDTYLSPSVKRQVWQTLKIIQEIKKVTGHDPKKVFFEFARDYHKKGEKSKKRKDIVLELYKKFEKKLDIINEYNNNINEINKKININELKDELNNQDEKSFLKDKIFLYYIQLGKDMYTGEAINISELFVDSSLYNIDHIYPRSKTKDDSLDNRVLVNTKKNLDKKYFYPIRDDIRKKMSGFWKILLEKKLISRNKYDRLIRNTPLTEDELQGFINKQIVETRQSTKEAASILRKYMPKTTVVYSKASNVSEFRNFYKIIKCREVNDLHHAKDAYLNIVVGEIFHNLFSIDFFKNKNKNKDIEGYNLIPKEIFKYRLKNVWDNPKQVEELVKRTLSKNNILFTRQTLIRKGKLFDENLTSASGKNRDEKASSLFPPKASDVKLKKLIQEKGKKEALKEWIKKYGGYDNLTVSYFFLVKHKNNVSFEPVYTVYLSQIKNTDDLLRYCESVLELEEPRILISKIKINTLVKYDGFPMHISGKSGSRIIIKPAVQLCISAEEEQYLKTIIKFNAKVKEYNSKDVMKKYEITDEKNISLYQTFLSKLETIYSKRPSNQRKIIENNLDGFKELSVEQQVKVLNEILKHFSCNNLTSNLELIKGAENAGNARISKNLTLEKNYYVINQSLTGLFENITNLNELANCCNIKKS